MALTGRVVKRNEKWAYVINLPLDPRTGRYPQKWKMGFSTKKEAQEALQKALLETDEIALWTKDFTLAEYLEHWLEKSVRVKNRPSTMATYEQSVRIISQHLGKIKLRKLRPHQIEALYERLTEVYEPSTLYKIHRNFRTALGKAVKWGYLKENPMTRVDSPANRKTEKAVLTPEQLQQCLNYLQVHSPVIYMAVFLAAHTGMRRGEVAGLQWRDVDLESQTIRVERSLSEVKGKVYISEPKTTKSLRTIAVSEQVLEALNAWKSHLEAQLQRPLREEDWVLVTKKGTPIHPIRFSVDFRNAVKKLDLPPVTFHGLRHTHATLLLMEKVPLKIISERLGHASITITADTYAHVTETMQREAVEALDRIFSTK